MYVAKIGELYFSDVGSGTYTSYLVTPIGSKAYIFGEDCKDEKLVEAGFKFYKLSETEVKR